MGEYFNERFKDRWVTIQIKSDPEALIAGIFMDCGKRGYLLIWNDDRQEVFVKEDDISRIIYDDLLDRRRKAEKVSDES